MKLSSDFPTETKLCYYVYTLTDVGISGPQKMVKLVSFGLEIGLELCSSSCHASRNIREKVALIRLVSPGGGKSDLLLRDSLVSNPMMSFGFPENCRWSSPVE
jgi:hypothetical protein